MYQKSLKIININFLYCSGLKKHDTANFHTQKQSLQLPTLIRRFHTDRYAKTIINPEKLFKKTISVASPGPFTPYIPGPGGGQQVSFFHPNDDNRSGHFAIANGDYKAHSHQGSPSVNGSHHHSHHQPTPPEVKKEVFT